MINSGVKTIQSDKDKINYPKCLRKKQHANQTLSFVCLSTNCKYRGLTCTLCRGKDHTGHNVMPIRTLISSVGQMLEKNRKGQVEQNRNSLMQQLYKSQQKYIEMLTMLKFHVQQLTQVIMNCQKQIISSYNELIKNYHEYSDRSETLLQTIKQFQRQAQIDSNVVKNSVQNILTYVKADKKQCFEFNQEIQLQFHSYQMKAKNFLCNIQQWEKQSQKMLSDLFIKNVEQGVRIQRSQTANISQGKQSTSSFSLLQKPNSIVLSNQNKVAKIKGSDGPKIIFIGDKLVEMKGVVRIKILYLSASSTIGIGVGLSELLKIKSFKFDKTLGHGIYMATSNNCLFSHSQIKQNSVMKGLTLKTGDQVLMEIQTNMITFKKKQDTKNTVSLSLKGLKQTDWKQLKFCVCLSTNGDKVQII